MKYLNLAIVTVLGLAVILTPARVSAEDCQGNKETIGTVAGALIGGILGNQIGSGSGRKAATILGAVAGGYAGNRIGEQLDCADQQYHAVTTHDALEYQPSGRPSSWNNPDTGHSGTVMPVRTWQQEDGTYCRDFTQSIVVEGRVEEATGTACRNSDGTWRIASSEQNAAPTNNYGDYSQRRSEERF
jgi:surface antigen